MGRAVAEGWIRLMPLTSLSILAPAGFYPGRLCQYV
jgi:hypothetical protein